MRVENLLLSEIAQWLLNCYREEIEESAYCSNRILIQFPSYHTFTNVKDAVYDYLINGNYREQQAVEFSVYCFIGFLFLMRL